MKMTVELPAPLVHQFRASVPTRERSQFIADLLTEKLQGANKTLAQAAQKANTLRQVNRDMKDWEALNGYAD